jgi:hypothetical protein
LKEVRLKYGGPGVSDDDLLLRYFAGKDEVDAMRAAQMSKRHVSVGYPVLGLIEKLTKATNCNYIQVRNGGLSLTLKKGHSRS